ncbi:MAG: sugar phosphate nucleotidyltransferase [Nitrospiraceae bacterium]
MVAVILAGGAGTRLKPFTVTIPKPLLPLGETPILEVVIRQLAAAGIDRIVVALGYMPYLFTASIGDGSRWGVPINYCVEEQPLGTAGPLRLVKNLGEHFLVMNGDLLTTLDYRKLIAAHTDRRAFGTIAVSKRQVRIDYGVIVPGSGGLLKGYHEKPTLDYAVSMGINVLSREALAFIPAAGKFDMPDLMVAMQRAGKPVLCYDTDCYWQDIGRMDDYQHASEDFARDPARFLPDRKAKP